MKKILILFIIASLAILGYVNLISNKQDQPIVEQTEVISQNQVETTIYYGDNTTNNYTTDITANDTVLSVLKTIASNHQLEIEIQSFDFGDLVQSINGYRGSDKKAWIYYVNGQAGDIGADQKQVLTGDLIEWKYEDIIF